MHKLYLTLTLILLTQYVGFAQKLPNVQQTSMLIPANIKIDGKATEWDNQYQAYNKNTEIFYTIANDTANLYLLIHAIKPRIIEKIIEGGISFTAYNPDKKEVKNNITVLFPLLSINKARSLLISVGKKISDDVNSRAMQDAQPNLAHEHVTSIVKTNKDLVESQKEIKVNGIKSIVDTVAGVTYKSSYYAFLPLHMHDFRIIGINNNDGIKAMTQFDNNGTYIYEMILPLKYLFFLNDQQKLKYTVTINSRGEDERYNDIIRRDHRTKHLLDQDLEAPTDFSGEYTLATKP